MTVQAKLFFALAVFCAAFAAPKAWADACNAAGCYAAYGYVPLSHGQLLAPNEISSITITDPSSADDGRNCMYTSEDRVFDADGVPAPGTLLSTVNPNLHILADSETARYAELWLKNPPVIDSEGQCRDQFDPRLPGLQLPEHSRLQILGYKLEGGPGNSLMFALVRVRR